MPDLPRWMVRGAVGSASLTWAFVVVDVGPSAPSMAMLCTHCVPSRLLLVPHCPVLERPRARRPGIAQIFG